jgi:hypothetical protein
METSTTIYLSSLVQRCHIYCKIVTEITALGDHHVRKVLKGGGGDQGQGQGEAKSHSLKSAVSTRERSGSSSSSAKRGAVSPQAAVESYLAASSLYLHALAILRNLMCSIEDFPVGSSKQGFPTSELRSKLKEVRMCDDISQHPPQQVYGRNSCPCTSSWW